MVSDLSHAIETFKQVRFIGNKSMNKQKHNQMSKERGSIYYKH